MQNRFQDENKRLSEFYNEVWVVCSSCQKRAVARANHEKNEARLFCANCGYNKTHTTEANILGINGYWDISAHSYFEAELWLKAPFKNEVFWAYNLAHLEYLEQYISSKLREHKDRSHFTLLEKLPKFYHEAKNREALLKLIVKLKSK
ncbi:MAG: hypothetical protein DI598_14575 [Pseudopedobacter saltans]|uniref:Uncharacterized protein n=1 Tax=Pseudopedobacter saltans TaxID=151895 RepID=A0A2W5ER34_9SPHI|nr:MAG: hypothetical protein DI598_14575 [Pseudopedobacter saltans]